MCVNFVNICKIYILACVVWKWHNAFHMHRGNLEKLGVSAWHEINETMFFSHLAQAPVRESVRTRDTGLGM